MNPFNWIDTTDNAAKQIVRVFIVYIGALAACCAVLFGVGWLLSHYTALGVLLIAAVLFSVISWAAKP